MEIVITDCDHGFFTPEESIIGGAGHRLKIVQCLDGLQVVQAAQNADAIICQRAQITREVLQALPRCRVVARYGVGVDNIDLAAAREQGVAVVYAPDFCTEEVAEHTIALLLALVRRPAMWDRRMRADAAAFNASWEGRVGLLKGIRPLRGLALGIVGLGRIGTAVAQRAQALGLTVMAADPYAPLERFYRLRVREATTEDLLRTADVVTLHVPLSASTRHFFGEEQLRFMKPSAYFINTCRGEVVDQDALLRALKEGWIAGAALDVTYPEPLPADHPLYRMDNVILTPHVAFYSDESIVALKEQIARYVLNALSGEGPYPTPEI